MINYPPLISIIVPVYNVASYLPVCLHSIVNQTYQNLEIIVVDDGSKDDSGKICDEYASIDSRIVVIHKENQGVSQARNDGIKKANGDYIMFVDSDDWIDFEMCDILFDSLSKYNVEAAVCSYVREYPNRSLPKEILKQDTVFDGSTFQRKLFGPINEEIKSPENLESFNSMCGKLFPRSALYGISVVDLALIGSSEDLLFNLEVFFNISNVVYINRALYHYRKDVETSITSNYKSELEYQWANLYDRMFQLIESNKLNQEYTLALKNRIALNVLGLGLNSVCDNAGFMEKYVRVKQVIFDKRRSNALKSLPVKYMPIYWKLFYLSAKWKFASLLCLLLMIIKKMKGKV